MSVVGKPIKSELMSGPSQTPGLLKAFRPSTAHDLPFWSVCYARTAVRREKMSITALRTPPIGFANYEEFKTGEADRTDDGFIAERESDNKAIVQKAVLLRDDHIVLSAIGVLLMLSARLKRWRNRRRTLQALADLDECQLRDIGLTRDGPVFGTSSLGHYRPLAELDDHQRDRLSQSADRRNR